MSSTTFAPTCNHFFADNHRCGSPALRGECFCYYHHPSRKPAANSYAHRALRGFHLPAPRNQRELQQALGAVITRLASNKLDVHRAGLLLYSLQIASQNLPTM